jgi:hypothetical protein
MPIFICGFMTPHVLLVLHGERMMVIMKSQSDE